MNNRIYNNERVRESLFQSSLPYIAPLKAIPDLTISRLEGVPLEHNFYRGLFPIQIPRLDRRLSWKPAKFFFRGSSERDRRRVPRKIPYLLQESSEEERLEKIPGFDNYVKAYLPLKGRWQVSLTGIAYLDLDDRFIHSLYPLLPIKGVQKPPYFTFHEIPYGAHSPVILSEEIARKRTDRLPLSGEEIHFHMKGVYSIRPENWEGVERVFFIKIEAPRLERFRQRIFCPGKIGGHDFHIVIGILPEKPNPSKKKRSLPLMRINPGYLPV